MRWRARRSEARRSLLEKFVAVYDDDPELTLQTSAEDAILRLPGDQQHEARILLFTADIDAERLPLKELFGKDPETY
ncbi:MAG: hypothetical protein ACRDHU_00340 [Actinomycetota bacterium]